MATLCFCALDKVIGVVLLNKIRLKFSQGSLDIMNTHSP